MEIEVFPNAKRIASSSPVTAGSTPRMPSTATPQASQEKMRSMSLTTVECGKVLASTRATRRMTASDSRICTPSRSRNTGW
ncbi:hypothetical protein D3C72_2365820 [compost metagenome]